MLRLIRTLVVALCFAASGAWAEPAPTFTSALPALVTPSPATLDALQKALDEGWPTDGATLAAFLDQNRAALDALRSAIEAGASDLPATRAGLSELRLGLGLTLLQALRAGAAHDGAACERDLQTVVAAARLLLAAPDTSLRIVGLSALARGATVAKRAGVSLPAVSLPPLADLVAFEKRTFLAAADRAAEADGSLAPHIRASAAKLAGEFYDPLARPLTQPEIVALVERFEALYSDLGKRYGVMDPKKVTELIPMPAPPPRTLGEWVAGVVLCARFLETRTLVRRYREVEAALKGGA